MKREITKCLLEWKVLKDRRPLIIRGARQIGKSYTIKEFGSDNFENIVEVNLETGRHLKNLFSTLDPVKICTVLALEFNQEIIAGKTLLFIDEIQESSDAFLSLRYFYEKMPDLHVICAGSLFDLALDQDKDLRVPVGRIEYLYMQPLSFLEFLQALDENKAHNLISNIKIDSNLSSVEHEKLLSLFNQYILCGGMPAVVNAYRNSTLDLRYRKIQADLINTYKDDFRKYKTRIDYEKLEFTFNRIPLFIAKNIKINEICPNFGQATTKNILNLMAKAKVIHSVKTSLANGLPLGAEIKERKNKFILLDIGLLNSVSNINIQTIQNWSKNLVNSGNLAEQIVGQELIAYSNAWFAPELYCWTRDMPSSSAEVDFLFTYEDKILPIEVKAGSTGHLKSMRIFMTEKKSPLGIRISQHELSYSDGILSVPFYAISKINSLVNEISNSKRLPELFENKITTSDDFTDPLDN